jgi:hypothetical protein
VIQLVSNWLAQVLVTLAYYLFQLQGALSFACLVWWWDMARCRVETYVDYVIRLHENDVGGVSSYISEKEDSQYM